MTTIRQPSSRWVNQSAVSDPGAAAGVIDVMFALIPDRGAPALGRGRGSAALTADPR